ncbi:MAG: hypothetical protein J5528_04925 [Firmicutes bacterium]|nr:hypothetical protein [Bacillota bacterium]
MGRIFSFFGADSKCGTSQTVLSLAMTAAGRHPELKVLLVNAEEALGDDYIPEISQSMEEIKPYLKDSLWDMESILRNSVLRKNLSIIGGANRTGSGSLYSPEKVRDFLLDAATFYDLVLCDCGSDICHGLSLGALISSGKRCIVLTQGEKALRRFEWLRPVLSKFDLDGDIYICCKYTDANPCDRYYIDHRLYLEKGSVIPVAFSEDGRKAEFYRRPLLSFKNRKYVSDIEKLAGSLFAQNGF